MCAGARTMKMKRDDSKERKRREIGPGDRMKWSERMRKIERQAGRVKGRGSEGKCTKQRKRACNGRRGWVCDIACCKLQFCCEIIIKYIMPSRLLLSLFFPLWFAFRRSSTSSTKLATFLLVFSACARRFSPHDGATL